MKLSANDTFQLLDNLLSWSRKQLNSLNCTPVYFDLITIIQSTFQLLDATAKRKDITIKVPDEEEILVYADEEMIKSIFRNILLNAIKFSARKSVVNIFTQREDKHVQVTIEDSGTGIPEKQIPLLFEEKYYSTKGTSGEKGTGLGLNISKVFIELNQGKIWVESKPGEGSRFHFTIPARKH
jgi:signal transduction histidine kinase